jgi:hypothetical protein
VGVIAVQLGAKDDWTSLNLSGAKLRLVDRLLPFQAITYLDLADNLLETLEVRRDRQRESERVLTGECRVRTWTSCLC